MALIEVEAVDIGELSTYVNDCVLPVERIVTVAEREVSGVPSQIQGWNGVVS